MRKVLTLLALALLSAPIHAQESLTIGIIDFYGLRSTTEDEVRAVLPFSVGDLISIDRPFPSANLESEMAEALEVSRVDISSVCCSEPNVSILYIGVEERRIPSLQYRPEPTGNASLPPEIQETDRKIETAMKAAVRAGDAEEDRSKGHSLMMNPEVRALQERYVHYAEIYREILIEVLHGSAKRRDLAATVLACASDKKAIVPHLQAAVLDPDDEVRNNATRALALIAVYAKERPELGIEIRADVFVDMLNSVGWSDRNKASAILFPLTDSRDPAVIKQIRAKGLPSLIEMCRWTWEGHSWAPCKILDRAVGLPDQDEFRPKDIAINMALELLRTQSSE